MIASGPTTGQALVMSQTARNALRASVRIAELSHFGPVTVAELAKHLTLPRNYLSKTLHRLSFGGVLASTRGRGGGFSLASAPEETPLRRIIDAVDPSPGTARWCLLGRSTCGGPGSCAAHAHWCEVRMFLDEFLARTTLADLIPTDRSPLPQEER